MSISLRETLAKRSDGTADRTLDWSEVGRHLREHYLNNEDEKARKEKAAQRQRFYQCRGDQEMYEMLCQVYESDKVVDLRRRLVEFAKYNNVLRRVTNEIATVYSLPAVRKVAGDDNNQRYQEVQRLSRQHEVMHRINRLAFLHRAVAVGPRMRMCPSGQWEPVIDVITPANFHAVRDPLDPTQLIALIFENDYQLASSVNPGPRWTVWGWHEVAMVSSGGELLESTVREHGYPRIPWVLLTLEPPDGALLDQNTGDDLIAAQKMIWFLNILHAKESKSTTVQTIIQGDVSQAVRGQVNDSDATGQLPEGTVVSTINRAVDVSIFLRGAQHAGETTGSNYGIAPHVMRGESVASADARELDRLPLRELRLQQQIPFREFERELAAVQAFTVAEKRPDLAFTTDGWSVNFSDPQTPLGTKEALEVFEHKRRLTLTSTRKYLMDLDPDLTPDGAQQLIEEYVADEVVRNLAMRPLQRINGSPAAIQPGGDIPGQPISNDNAEDVSP